MKEQDREHQATARAKEATLQRDLRMGRDNILMVLSVLIVTGLTSCLVVILTVSDILLQVCVHSITDAARHPGSTIQTMCSYIYTRYHPMYHQS